MFVKTAMRLHGPGLRLRARSIGGVGTVFILGMAVLLIGVVLMFVMRLRHPAFFRGEILRTRK